MPTEVSTPPSIPRRTITWSAWRCRRMERFWRAFAFAEELEQPLVEDHRARDRTDERRRDGLSIAIAQVVQQLQCGRAAGRLLVPRFGFDQVDLAEPEPREVVAAVLRHVRGIGRAH